MPTYPLSATYLNVETITAEQALSPSISNGPYMFTTDFANWVEANQPVIFNVYYGQLYITLPEYNTSGADYLANWYIPIE